MEIRHLTWVGARDACASKNAISDEGSTVVLLVVWMDLRAPYGVYKTDENKKQVVLIKWMKTRSRYQGKA